MKRKRIHCKKGTLYLVNPKPTKKPKIEFIKNDNSSLTRVKDFLTNLPANEVETPPTVDVEIQECDSCVDLKTKKGSVEDKDCKVEMNLILGVFEEKEEEKLIFEDSVEGKKDLESKIVSNCENDANIRLSSEITPRERKEEKENTRALLNIMKFFIPKDENCSPESKEKNEKKE